MRSFNGKILGNYKSKGKPRAFGKGSITLECLG